MLKLLPSTIWLYQYVIEPCLRRGGRGWLYLPITYLAQRPGAPSRSALQRAVNQLAEREEVFGLELSLLWKDGRPQLLVASQDWLKYDRRALHFWDKKRTKVRHLRSRCRSRDFLELDAEETTHCLNHAPDPYPVSKETAAVNSETSSFRVLSTRCAPQAVSRSQPRGGIRNPKLQRLARYVVSVLRKRHARPGSGFDGHRVYGIVIQLLAEGRKRYRILDSFGFHWRTTTTSRPETKLSLVTWKMRSRDFPFTRAVTTRRRIANLQVLLGSRAPKESAVPVPPLPELSPLEKFLERIEDTEKAGPGPGELAALWLGLTEGTRMLAQERMSPLAHDRMGRVLVALARFSKPWRRVNA